MMNSLVGYFLESNLYLICIYLLDRIILMNDKHFGFNRIFLLGGVLLSLTLPLLSFNIVVAPAQSMGSFEGYIVLPAITITTAQTESVGFILKWWHIIGIAYAGGMLFYFSRLLWQIMQILRHLPLLNSSRDRKNKYTLITTNGEMPTCSFFKFLFWDKSVHLEEEEKQQVLAHELAHIRQWHSLDILFIELLRIVFWINPVIHLIKARITEVHEFLADHDATRGKNPENYRRVLTMQIFKSFDFALSNNFHRSQVAKRIRMLNSGKSKSIWLNLVLLVPAMILLITILSCNVTDQILPDAALRDHYPELPEGWVVIGQQDLPAGLLTSYKEYIKKDPGGHSLIVQRIEQGTSPAKLFENMIQSDWHGVYIDNYDSKDFAFFRQGDPAVDKVIFEEAQNHAPIAEENTSDPKEIFTIVENQPAPSGGMKAYYEYIRSNLRYPYEARRRGIEGKVFVEFVVAPDGRLTDVKTAKGIGAGCDEEAVRVIRESLPWNPGTQNGRNVHVRMILPISFKLG
ncbi:MAG: M56 family metallopeptidase [Cytophagales bacterium]|nr:M56 family metallopeptidase [Cytophagales bacterium]